MRENWKYSKKTDRNLSLARTSDISISTRSIRKQSMIYPLRLVNTKQEFFFVSSFVLLLAYASTMFLCLCFMSLYMSQAWLHSFVLPFVCPYAYAYFASVNQALNSADKENHSKLSTHKYIYDYFIRRIVVCLYYNDYSSKRSVLRRQSRDTNRNIKRSVYCQYG